MIRASLCALLASLGTLLADAPCRIEVVDAENGWPVPLVELRTTHLMRFVTDNAGIITIDEPDLFGHETWFDVLGHGYGVAPDGFGMRGVRLTLKGGETLRVPIQRANIAKRLGRVTGDGLFAESGIAGPPDIGVFGRDSVQLAPHRGRLFWAWGDTSLRGYPLGIFHMTGATTAHPPLFDPKPPLIFPLDHFKDAKGAIRPLAQMAGPGPTWLNSLVSLPSQDGNSRLVATYVKIEPPLTAYEQGFCVWDDKAERFEPLKVLWTRSAETPKPPPAPDGHPIPWTDPTGKNWILFGNPFPNLRCPATFEEWQNPATWEVIPTPATVTSVTDGKTIAPHTGSVAWNGWRKRWVTIFTQKGGRPSTFGEVWYAEAPNPTGPWSPAIKVLTHDNYTFYNPRVQSELTAGDSPILLFEGTYTAEFADHAPPTPRWNYNQVMYRLDLDDPKLGPAQGR